MRTTPYYSLRTGKRKSDRFDLAALKHLFLALFRELEEKGHFQEHFGYACVNGDVFGKAGSQIGPYWFRRLKRDLYPVADKIEGYTEDELFDVIEFLYDHVSKGTKGGYHNHFLECGWHYSEFSPHAGQQEYRLAVNELLKDYAEGFELSPKGEVLTLPNAQLLALMNTPLPDANPVNVTERVATAIHKFRGRSSSPDDCRDAVRDLADVLEYLRPQAKHVLQSKDEGDLFELANRFAIRHNNAEQKSQYDKRVWLSWMFHYYLATIHAVQHLLERKGAAFPSRLDGAP
jgi:hypothetical protein